MKAVIAWTLLLSFNAFAIETDQFVTWNVELKDSTPVINEYIQNKMNDAIKKANSKKNWSCQKLSQEVFNKLVGKFKISEISTWAAKTPLIERYPETKVEMKSYQDISLYQHAQFPISTVGLSRNININGIYMGTDKLGHFILLGRNYYNRFQRKIKKFKGNYEQAMLYTIRRGIRDEYIYLGYALGGVFSFGDLEANYRGLLFGLDICEKDNPFVTRSNGKWVLNPEKSFDIREYLGPKMDESYNLSFWKPKLWKKSVSKVIKNNYCSAINSDLIQKRWAHYRKLQEGFDKKESQDHILKLFFNKMFEGRLAKRAQTLDSVCQ